MKKVLLIIFISMTFSLHANEDAKEGKIARYVMENIQKVLEKQEKIKN